MAKKRFESLNTAEQLTAAVEQVLLLLPGDASAEAAEELRRTSSSAVNLLLEHSESEFRNTVRSVKSQSKARQPSDVCSETSPNTVSEVSGTSHSTQGQ